MINELHQLARAMREADVETESWYRRYIPIPKVRKNAPCVRIVVSDGKVKRVESISAEQGECIRKYGDNQGTFPAMNLAPLYRIADKEIAKNLSQLIQNNGQGIDIDIIKKWCVCDNWCKKFCDKYRVNMEKRPKELLHLLQGRATFEPVQQLIEAVQPFADPKVLYGSLEEKVFELLAKKKDSVLALQILFYVGKENDAAEKDYGGLSVVIDTEALEEDGMSSAGTNFTKGLNKALLQAATEVQASTDIKSKAHHEKDAFGSFYVPTTDPMPDITLAGGFKVSLRTMFRGQPCQYRYARIENETYPINHENRQQLKTALDWLGSKDMQGKTWVKTDKQEILFVYPSKLPEFHPSFISPFQRTQTDKEASFEVEAQNFREYVTKTKEADTEHYPENMQFFILRKLDKARTKVVYTRCANPDEIIACSGSWRQASQNLPTLPPIIARPWTPFPLEIANIMNRVWKRDGTLASDKYKPVASYHGLELLLDGTESMWYADLRRLVDNSWNLAVYAGFQLNTMTGRSNSNPKDKTIWQVREALVLMGMFLHWLHIRKGDYVNKYPYLLGQLLKVSDALHELYCHEVRNGEIPPQLIGSGLYVSATETPIQALAQLGNRVNPYITWAKTNKDKRITVKLKDKEGIETVYQGPTAGYLLSVYSRTADLLKSALTEQSRFNDQEKALLFIGYLASFPKSESKEEVADIK